MSTYTKTYYKAISTEQSNRIKAYITYELFKIDNYRVQKFFDPLLTSLKNGHRYLVFGCNYSEPDKESLILVKLNAYFQHPFNYDVGELVEINSDITESFSLPKEYDDSIKQIIRKFINILLENGNVNRLQEQETAKSGGEVYSGCAVYGEPNRIEYAAGRSCDEARVICQREGLREPKVELSVRHGEVHKTSWGN